MHLSYFARRDHITYRSGHAKECLRHYMISTLHLHTRLENVLINETLDIIAHKTLHTFTNIDYSNLSIDGLYDYFIIVLASGRSFVVDTSFRHKDFFL